MLLPAGRAHAAFEGRNGAIGYQGRASANGVLYLREPGGRARLLRVPRRLTDPAFSPQGRRIAFASNGRIWIMQADGSSARKLTTATAAFPSRSPAWSPGGEALAFEAGAPGARDIFRVGAHGLGLRRLTSGAADEEAPAWSSRNEVAFVRRTPRGDGDLYVMGAGGGAGRRLTHGRRDDGSPAWSPDGRRIAFTRGSRSSSEVFVIRADGSHLRRLTSLPRGVASPAWSPNGRWIAFGMGRRGRRALYVVRSDGRSLRRVASGSSDARSIDWQPVGGNPVVAAAGDIACDPLTPSFADGLGTQSSCHQLQTSDLLLTMDLSAVLVLGDAQYQDGALWKFQQSFDPAWGRLKSLLRPVPGNHDYRDPGASGYFDYFDGPGQPNGPAGPRELGYYSFDVGAWHVVALNSQCSARPPEAVRAGDCAAGSVQEQWLRADLAAHPRPCTLAFWHHPLVSSGRGGVDEAVRPLWQALYEANVDVVLNGHDHGYERFAPIDPAGARDGARGIREFIVGTGGRSHARTIALQSYSEAREDSTFGVLELTLGPRAYRWSFVPEAGGRFTDAGVSACH